MPELATDSTRQSSVLWKALWSGTFASVFSLIPLCLLGRKATGHWTPAPNAISHWLWGRPALHKKGLTLRHTIAGIFIHHIASIFWALWFETAGNGKSNNVWLRAGVTSMIACLVDFRLTPERLTPGFEHHLFKKDLAVVYGCFAVGLAISSTRR